MRCDTCSDPLSEVWWIHWTADSVPVETRAELLATTEPSSDGLITVVPNSTDHPDGTIFEDPEWSVCAGCHQLIEDNNLQGLIARYIRAMTEDFHALAQQGHQAEAGILFREGAVAIQIFWEHRTGRVERGS